MQHDGHFGAGMLHLQVHSRVGLYRYILRNKDIIHLRIVQRFVDNSCSTEHQRIARDAFPVYRRFGAPLVTTVVRECSQEFKIAVRSLFQKKIQFIAGIKPFGHS